MPPRLVPLSDAATAPIVLNRPVLLVGRHPECDVRLDPPAVSRRHCCLALAGDRALVRDLGSRHGVRVNGRVVEESPLRPGDEVSIAHLIYRFEDPAAALPSSHGLVAHRPASDETPVLPIDYGGPTLRD